MKRLLRGGITGPTASMIDLTMLLFIFMMTVALQSPPQVPEVDIEFVSEPELAEGATKKPPPLVTLHATVAGVYIDTQKSPLPLAALSAALAPLSAQEGVVALCVLDIPFQDHWDIRSVIVDTLGREPHFIPCKEDYRQ